MPSPVGDLDFNCCPDPDCENFDVSADVNIGRFLGRGTPAWKAALLSHSSVMGLGAYKLHSSAQKEIHRVSTTFEYANNPHTWMDGREVRCQAARQRVPCDAGFGAHDILVSMRHAPSGLAALGGGLRPCPAYFVKSLTNQFFAIIYATTRGKWQK